MKLDKNHMDMLSQYEDTLAKFKTSQYGNISFTAKRSLQSIYLQITKEKVCSRCNNAWLHRLSTWYFDNKQQQ